MSTYRRPEIDAAEFRDADEESVQPGREPQVAYSIATAHGGRSSQGSDGSSRERIRAAEPVLRALGGAWAPWPGRG